VATLYTLNQKNHKIKKMWFKF